MQFDIITIFPEIFDCYFKQSLIARAQKKRLLKIKAHNLRVFTKDKHKTIDDKPFGGGRGMILKVGPISQAVKKLKKKKKSKVVLFSPRGKKFNQKMASKWAKLDQLILICGRYEGVDERVAKHIADETLAGADLPGD